MPRTDRISLKIFKKPLWLLAVCLVLLTVFSTLGLDLINRNKGEKTYIFAARKVKSERASLPVREKPQEEKEYRVPLPKPEKKVESETEPALPPPIESPIEEGKKSKVLQPKEEEKGVAKSEPLISPSIESPLKTEQSPAAVQPVITESAAPRRKKGKVAIIVDDMGNSLQTIEDLCSIDLPLTIAILPYSSWPVETANVAHNHGLEVILHLPLESLNDHESNEETEGLIHSNMSEEEILAILEINLQQVPFISGVNNHMGSKITAERELMMPILETLKEKNLYFVDSVTTGKSVAYLLARQLRIPTAERHVFLDNDPSEESIRRSLIQLFRLAQRRGMAVGICHPLETTVRVLLENLASIEDFNCDAVFVSQILH
jgi:polysaccharide deacetylase 2 family uncharacterized protein YibQ